MRVHGHSGRHGHGPFRPHGGFHCPFWGPRPFLGPVGGSGCLIGFVPLLLLALMLFRPH